MELKHLIIPILDLIVAKMKAGVENMQSKQVSTLFCRFGQIINLKWSHLLVETDGTKNIINGLSKRFKASLG